MGSAGPGQLQPNGYWPFMKTRGLAAGLDLSGINCQMALAVVYAGVEMS